MLLFEQNGVRRSLGLSVEIRGVFEKLAHEKDARVIYYPPVDGVC